MCKLLISRLTLIVGLSVRVEVIVVDFAIMTLVV
jgi:hypothetical protein